jgi:hypothetical protein
LAIALRYYADVWLNAVDQVRTLGLVGSLLQAKRTRAITYKHMTEQKEEDNSELLKSIIQIRGAMEKLMKSGLNKKAIIVLIQDRVRLPKNDIEKVLDSLCNLEKWYTNYK